MLELRNITYEVDDNNENKEILKMSVSPLTIILWRLQDQTAVENPHLPR